MPMAKSVFGPRPLTKPRFGIQINRRDRQPQRQVRAQKIRLVVIIKRVAGQRRVTFKRLVVAELDQVALDRGQFARKQRAATNSHIHSSRFPIISPRPFVTQIRRVRQAANAHSRLDKRKIFRLTIANLISPMPPLNAEKLAKAKSLGFSDRQIAHLTGTTEDAIRAVRKKLGLVPSYRLVDTCAAEFEAYTPYYYSTYDRGDDEVKGNTAKKVMILGGGPNRIGQGIEFDYCCVHAAFALKEDGFETIMVNSNPETVSTDYDTSDKLFFEPLTLEDVLHIYEREKCWGAIAQFGGQTPLNLALGLQKNGVNIIGTSPQSIEIAEDRKLFAAMLDKLDIPQPPNGLATNEAEALDASPSGWVIRCWCGRASCWAGARCRSFIPTPSCRITCGSPSKPRRNGPCWWINFSKTPRKWTWIASPMSAISRIRTRAPLSSAGCWSTSNLPACIPATPRWFCRRTRFPKKSSPPSANTPTPWRAN